MVPRRIALVSALGLTVLGSVAVPAAGADTAPHQVVSHPGVVGSKSADDPVNRVVAISVDGLNPKAIRVLGPSRAPNFHRMMRQGATTLNARTAREQTRTLPNHTGMLTGRRVAARTGGTG